MVEKKSAMVFNSLSVRSCNVNISFTSNSTPLKILLPKYLLYSFRVFIEKSDYLFMLMNLKDISKKRSLEIYAFCFMPNHIHLLVSPRENELHESMRDLFSRYAMRFNKKVFSLDNLALRLSAKASLSERIPSFISINLTSSILHHLHILYIVFPS